jgi:hypothetical protein
MVATAGCIIVQQTLTALLCFAAREYQAVSSQTKTHFNHSLLLAAAAAAAAVSAQDIMSHLGSCCCLCSSLFGA